MKALLAWWPRTFWRHQWEKDRNPYRRRCIVCGRQEQQMCWSMDTWNRAWWEVWNEGDETKHYTKGT